MLINNNYKIMFEMSPYSNNYLYFGNNFVQYQTSNINSNKSLGHSRSVIYHKKSPIKYQINNNSVIPKITSNVIKIPHNNNFFIKSKELYKSSANMNIEHFLEKYNIQKTEMDKIKKKNSEILKLQDNIIESQKEVETLNSDRESLKKKIYGLEEILKEKDQIIELYQQKENIEKNSIDKDTNNTVESKKSIIQENSNLNLINKIKNLNKEIDSLKKENSNLLFDIKKTNIQVDAKEKVQDKINSNQKEEIKRVKQENKILYTKNVTLEEENYLLKKDL